MTKRLIEVQSETGTTMAEYTVVLGVITLAIVTTFSILSNAFATAFDNAVDVFMSVV
jgi:Flp pilus assembly pilin Flp